MLARGSEGDDDGEGGSGGGGAARRRRDWCRCRAWTVSVAWSWHAEQRVWLCRPAILLTGSGLRLLLLPDLRLLLLLKLL